MVMYERKHTFFELESKLFITKTYLNIFTPLNPTFYILVKQGFTVVEPPCRGSSNEYPQSMFWAEI